MKYTIRGTDSSHHATVGRPYVLVVPPEMWNRCRSSELGVVRRVVTDERGDRRVLRAVVAIVPDPTASAHELRMDQTLRTAFGIDAVLQPEGVVVELEVFPVSLTRGDRWRNLLSSWAGRRYLLLRVAKPAPSDIEKRMCRIASDDLDLMGVPPGTKVVLFGAEDEPREDGAVRLRRIDLQAMPCDADAGARLESLQRAGKTDGWSARYVDAKHVLGIVGDDLATLYLDRDARESIGVDPGCPVLVRRHTPSVFFGELLEFGVVLLASFLALDGVVKPASQSLHLTPTQSGFVTLAVSLIVGLGLVFLRLRSNFN